jgi:hypothetical protein
MAAIAHCSWASILNWSTDKSHDPLIAGPVAGVVAPGAFRPWRETDSNLLSTVQADV